MILWLDAQLSPSVASWIVATFAIEAHAVRDLGLRNAKDGSIFEAARDAAAVMMTKDSDFVESVQRLGPPPKVLWLTCGNTSNARLREILTSQLPVAIARLEAGDNVVEIGAIVKPSRNHRLKKPVLTSRCRSFPVAAMPFVRQRSIECSRSCSTARIAGRRIRPLANRISVVRR